MPTVRLTFEPWREVFVSDDEYLRLLRQGLIFTGATPPPPPAFTNTQYAELANTDGEAAQRIIEAVSGSEIISGVTTSVLSEIDSRNYATASQVIPFSDKGNAGGVATLDVGGRIPEAQTPTRLSDANLSSKIVGEASPLLVPLNEAIDVVEGDTASNRAARIISAASVFEADFRTNTFRIADGGLTRAQALSADTLTRDANGATVARSAVTNLLPNLPFTGAALGVLGSGGALPTGWSNSNSSVTKEVLAFTSDSFTLKLGPQVGGSFGGVRSPAVSPSESTIFGIGLEGGSLPALSEPPAHMSVGWFKDGALSSLNNRLWWTGDSWRNVNVLLPQPTAGSNIALTLTAGSGAPTQTPIVTFSKPSLFPVSTVGSGVLALPPYATGSLAASNATFRVSNGEYVVMALTSASEYLRRRVVISGGAGLDLASAVGGWAQVVRVWVIPAASWTVDVADSILSLADPKWTSPVVRLEGGESSATLVMRALDRAQNGPNDVTGASADAAALRSVTLSQTFPGAMHFNVRPGDRAPFDGSTQERAEAHVPDKMPFDTEVWCAFWVRINTYPIDFSTDCSTSIMQARYTNDPGDTTSKSPDLSFRVYPKPPSSFQVFPPAGHVGLAMITNSTTSSPPTNDNNLVIRKWTFVKLGQWTQFVFRATFTRTGGGYLQYWQDGVSQFDAAIPLGHNRIQGPTLRFGSYSNTHQIATRDIDIRDVQYGLTSLSSRLTALAPL